MASLQRRKQLLEGAGLNLQPPTGRIDEQLRRVRAAANAVFKHRASTASVSSPSVVTQDTKQTCGGMNPNAVDVDVNVVAVDSIENSGSSKKKACRQRAGIPANRLAELMQTIKEYCGRSDVSEVTDEDIDRCRALEVSTSPPSFSLFVDQRNRRDDTQSAQSIGSSLSPDPEDEDTSTGANCWPEAALLNSLGISAIFFDKDDNKEMVAMSDISGQRESVQKFVEQWRVLFLEAVQPKCLPKGWSSVRPVWV